MKLRDLMHGGRRAWPPATISSFGPIGSLTDIQASGDAPRIVLVVDDARHVFEWDPPPSPGRVAATLNALVGMDLKHVGDAEIGGSRFDDADLRQHVDARIQSGALKRAALATRETDRITGVCSVCDEPVPALAYHFLDGFVVRLHYACEAIWKERWHQVPNRAAEPAP